MRQTIAAFVCLSALVVPAVFADEPSCPCPPAVPPHPLWTGSVGLSYVATSGNSDTRTLGLAAAFTRQPTPWGVEITALANRAETNGETTAEKWFAELRGTRALDERLGLFAGVADERNRFAGFDTRLVFEAGATWHALLGPEHDLTFDVGVTHTTLEPLAGGNDQSFGALAGLTYLWKFSSTAAFRERLVAYPSFKDTGDWRMRSETALEAALAASWAVRVGYLFERVNHPQPGFGKDDATTTVSLVWKR
jgi:putative salt-induced outer membrane protein